MEKEMKKKMNKVMMMTKKMMMEIKKVQIAEIHISSSLTIWLSFSIRVFIVHQKDDEEDDEDNDDDEDDDEHENRMKDNEKEDDSKAQKDSVMNPAKGTKRKRGT